MVQEVEFDVGLLGCSRVCPLSFVQELFAWRGRTHTVGARGNLTARSAVSSLQKKVKLPCSLCSFTFTDAIVGSGPQHVRHASQPTLVWWCEVASSVTFVIFCCGFCDQQSDDVTHRRNGKHGSGLAEWRSINMPSILHVVAHRAVFEVPRLFLSRQPRGGQVPQKKLQDRFAFSSGVGTIG